MRKTILLIVLIFTFINFYNADKASDKAAFSAKMLAEKKQKERCKYLNDARANFTVCCKYPTFVVWAWEKTTCREEAKAMNKEGNACVVNACLYRTRGILNYEKNEDGSIAKMNIDWKQIVPSFMISIRNDSKWLPVVTTSAEDCYNYMYDDGSIATCGLYPLWYLDIIDCIYEENFINCARWNPHNLKECDYSLEYVENCMNNIQFKNVI